MHADCPDPTVCDLSSRAIAHSPVDALSADALVRLAAQALAAAGGCDEVPLACVGLEATHALRRRIAMRAELQQAPDEAQFSLAWQPIVSLRSGRIVAFEALARWHHPQRGAVPPAEFIAFAESVGLIGRVTRWVVATAAAQLKRWTGMGLHHIRVCVNVPPSALDDAELEDQMRAVMADGRLRHGQIELEITERTLARHGDEALARLQALRCLGAAVALDDFGTGYSNLASLSGFPVDTVKIDLRFVQGAVGSQTDLAIARAICELARALDLRVIGEGIETEDQLAALARLGCHEGQGYLISRPVTADQAEHLLANDRAMVTPAGRRRRGGA